MADRPVPGRLYLIPAPLGEGDLAWVIPAAVLQCIAGLEYYVVEHPKTARQFLKKVGCQRPLLEIKMQVLDEHTPSGDLSAFLEPLLAGHDVGLLSEAGCPAVADPGADLIRLAHQKHIRVIPMVGPSSILLALMASGLNGQRFTFHGYLPIKDAARANKIMELEKLSVLNDQTQVFIETPYRNMKLLEVLTKTCRADTELCIACDITLESEFITTRTIKVWKNSLPEIHKRPAIFLLHG